MTSRPWPAWSNRQESVHPHLPAWTPLYRPAHHQLGSVMRPFARLCRQSHSVPCSILYRCKVMTKEETAQSLNILITVLTSSAQQPAPDSRLGKTNSGAARLVSGTCILLLFPANLWLSGMRVSACGRVKSNLDEPVAESGGEAPRETPIGNQAMRWRRQRLSLFDFPKLKILRSGF
jgi:hypothetical protein